MKSEKSFNNPQTLTTKATARRDRDSVIITLRHNTSPRSQNHFMSREEAKELSLELYKLSDSER